MILRLHPHFMTKHRVLYFILLLIYSCTHNQENESTGSSAPFKQDSLLPVPVTVLASLPDSLQPKCFALDTMPMPLTVAVPAKEGGNYKYTDFNGEHEYKLIPPVVTQLVDSISRLPIAPEAQGTGMFTNFGSDNGLVMESITSSLVESSGIIWIGTEGGVSRYDGKTFTTYSIAQGLPSNGVRCIYQNNPDTIWFGADGGVSCYNGRTFTTFSNHEALRTSVRSMLQDRSGNYWFGTTNGLVRFDGKAYTHFTTKEGLAGSVVRGIVQDHNGILWFGTDGGLSRYDGKEFTTFNSSNGLLANMILCLTEDRSGILWIGTHSGGLSRYDGKTFTNYTTADGLARNVVRCISQDTDGNLWIGVDRGGVSRFDGKTFTNFSTAQGLVNYHVRTISQDRVGSIWIGTLGGVSRYDGKSFTNFPFNARNIIQDRSGLLWFGTGTGVTRYDGKSLATLSAAQGFATSGGVLSALQDRNGNFWFGLFAGGLTRYDGKTFTNYSTAQGLADLIAWHLLEDHTGNLWIGTDGGGISRYDGKSFTNYSIAQGLPHSSVTSLIEDHSGTIWVGTGGGLSCFDGNKFLNLTTAQGLPNNQLYSIKEDQSGNLYLGTDAGLSVFSKEKQALFLEKAGKGEPAPKNLFENFNIDDGLPNNSVVQILLDDTNRIYLGTYNGICEMIRVNYDGIGSKGWRVGKIFNKKTGYPVKELLSNQYSLFKDNTGIIWITTNSLVTRLVRFDPKAIIKSSIPKLVINKIKINKENVCWNDLKPALKQDTSLTKGEVTPANVTEEANTFGKILNDSSRIAMRKLFNDISFDGISPWYPIPEKLVLPYANNDISFDFVAIETAKNSLINYQFILEGYDHDWSPPSNSTTANFGNMYEGAYTFKVKAQNADGVWGDPVSYSFKVLPPWWRTWWAYTIYVLLILIGLRYFIKWREHNLRMENEKLEKKVELRTAEVVAEKKKSDDLLLNILPEEVAEELKAKGSADAKQFDEVTVMFTDFKGFTQISEKLTPTELVAEIHTCFKAFDSIIEKYNIEKIKTIGDSYMCAGGLPVTNTTNAVDVVNAALKIQQFMQQHLQHRKAEGKEPFEIRIGVHTGPVVAGIVGVKKFAYDIWGDTVNIASRMESSGEAGKVNISSGTYELVKGEFKCEHRGKIKAKNKGEIDMYFVNG